MKKSGRIGAEILEQLSDNRIHRRADMLKQQKKLLRGKEEPHFDFDFSWTLTNLVGLGYINRENRGEYKITSFGLKALEQNRENLYKQIQTFKKISEKNSKFAYAVFKEANEIFVKDNINSLERNVAEDSLCSALGRSLEKVMETKGIDRNYHIDTNYNRNDYMYKTIINNECQMFRINCDLLIHSRGENKVQDNLLALEMKKKSNTKDRKENKERLKIMTKNTYYGEVIFEELPRHICRYALGIFYDIDKDKREIEMEFYKNGTIAWKEKIKYNKQGDIEEQGTTMLK